MDTVFETAMGHVRYIHSTTDAANQAMSRLQRIEWEKAQKKPFPKKWQDTDHVKQIMTRDALTADGNQQGHCIGEYGDKGARGDLFMFSIRVGRHRSSVQLTKDGAVVQHFARSNTKPSLECLQALQDFMMVNGLV
jgi:hypothetical protein